MAAPVPPPHRFRFLDEEKSILVADWRDGHVSAYPLRYLRGWCPCAECQGHSGSHHFVPQGVPTLAAIVPVGSYAIQLGWSDGHSTGIHPFSALRDMCPCAECGGAIEGTPTDVASLCLEAGRKLTPSRDPS